MAVKVIQTGERRKEEIFLYLAWCFQYDCVYETSMSRRFLVIIKIITIIFLQNTDYMINIFFVFGSLKEKKYVKQQ